MKRLVLIRHAKSSWEDPHLDDRERPLNKRGERDAPFMADLLTQRGLVSDQLISSPARRAITTARHFAARAGFPVDRIQVDERIYLRGIDALLELIHELPDSTQTAILVGHNPSLTELVDRLADANIGNMPTCSIASIGFEADSWRAVAPGLGRLEFFDYPKRHQGVRR